MAIRRPIFKPQIGDPTTNLDGYICTLESGAMGLDVVSGGKINVWGGNLIPYCGRSKSDIIAHGTNLYNVKKAWAHWGQDKHYEIRAGLTWYSLLNDLKAGYWVELQGDYDQFSLASRCQDSFRGPHAIILGPEFTASGTYILSGDPLCKTFKYLPAKQLRAYAEKLGKQNWSPWRGQIFYARFKPAAGVVVAAHYSAAVSLPTSLWNDGTKKWVYNNPAGPADNRVKVGTRLEVRPVHFAKGGVDCYPITSGTFSKNYAGYYVPVKNVKLGRRVN